MKKAIVMGLAVLGILGLAGCKKEQEQEQKKELSFVSADYQRGNTSKYLPEPMMKTEKGYYYYSEFYKGFRYYDVATDKEMYLCNKPECRHDGNQFCVATNEKYRVLDYCLYGENIMVYTTVTGCLHEAADFAAIGQWLAGAERYFLQGFKDSGDILGGDPAPFAVSDEQLEEFLAVVRAFIPSAEIRGR